eukprot:m.84377 g.84377  ORF g.84377 m.84377 type:complete len:94 (+) comp8714_c0_seq11:241-522(+)
MPRGQLVSYQIYPLRSHHYPSLLVPLHAPNDHYKYIYFTQTFMAARCKGVKHILSCSFIASGGQLSRTNSNTAMASSCEVEKYSLPSPEAAQM